MPHNDNRSSSDNGQSVFQNLRKDRSSIEELIYALIIEAAERAHEEAGTTLNPEHINETELRLFCRNAALVYANNATGDMRDTVIDGMLKDKDIKVLVDANTQEFNVLDDQTIESLATITGHTTEPTIDRKRALIIADRDFLRESLAEIAQESVTNLSETQFYKAMIGNRTERFMELVLGRPHTRQGQVPMSYAGKLNVLKYAQQACLDAIGDAYDREHSHYDGTLTSVMTLFPDNAPEFIIEDEAVQREREALSKQREELVEAEEALAADIAELDSQGQSEHAQQQLNVRRAELTERWQRYSNNSELFFNAHHELFRDTADALNAGRSERMDNQIALVTRHTTDALTHLSKQLRDEFRDNHADDIKAAMHESDSVSRTQEMITQASFGLTAALARASEQEFSFADENPRLRAFLTLLHPKADRTPPLLPIDSPVPEGDLAIDSTDAVHPKVYFEKFVSALRVDFLSGHPLNAANENQTQPYYISELMVRESDSPEGKRISELTFTRDLLRYVAFETLTDYGRLQALAEERGAKLPNQLSLYKYVDQSLQEVEAQLDDVLRLQDDVRTRFAEEGVSGVLSMAREQGAELLASARNRGEEILGVVQAHLSTEPHQQP